MLALLAGCAGRTRHNQTISHAELVHIVEASQHPSIPTQTYYCGSANGYDVFEVRSFVSGVQTYQVRSANCPISRRFPTTTDQSFWLGYHPFLGRFYNELSADGETRFDSNGSMEGFLFPTNLFQGLRP